MKVIVPMIALKNGIISLICASLIVIPAHGGSCPQNVTPIKKGEVAVCDGFLFSDEAEKQASKALDDSKYYKALSDKLFEREALSTKENDIMQRRLDLYISQSKVLAEQNVKYEDRTFWQNTGYFVLGAAATGLLGYAVIKSYR